MIRSRIVQVADELFNARGYRGVTISDIAMQLGMSKKTIYVYFAGKEEIATAVVDATMGRIAGKIQAADTSSQNPLQALRVTVEQIKGEVLRLRPIFLDDVQKLLPDLWQRIVDFRGERIVQFMQRSIQEAQKMGLAKSVDARLVSLIYMEAVQSMVKPDTLARYGYSVGEVMDALVDIFIGGISSASIQSHAES